MDRRGPSASTHEALPERSVVLWPDTFTNYFSPAIGMAAVEVLEAAGFEVLLPERPVCCGLTWLSTGQLPTARRKLRRSLAAVAPMVDAGIPLLVLEPSCAALLRSDAVELLPGDPAAELVASQTHTLAGLLHKHAPDWRPPQIGGTAAVQVHCHQHAVIGSSDDHALIRAAGVTPHLLDGGCCGLAGNFGFERGHFEVSRKVAEQGVLPALAAAPPEAAVVADGFSCRTQLEQLAGVRSKHLAELLAERL